MALLAKKTKGNWEYRMENLQVTLIPKFHWIIHKPTHLKVIIKKMYFLKRV